MSKVTKDDLDKFVEEVTNRPYLNYNELNDDEIDSLFSEKELREIKGIGPINKLKKLFRDINDVINNNRGRF